MMHTTTRRLGIALVAMVLVCGCGRPAAPLAESGMRKVTFAVENMGERLALLWDDWPNRVEEALSGLAGVELAQDVWDADLIHVTYDANKITVDQMLETIEKQGFHGTVKQD